MPSGPPFRVADSRRYRRLRNVLVFSALLPGALLCVGEDYRGLAGLLAAAWLWRLFTELDPVGASLMPIAHNTGVAGASLRRAWWLTQDEAVPPSIVELSARGRFHSCLWLECHPVLLPAHRVHRHRSWAGFGIGRCARPLLVFADAMDEGSWRALRRTLRVLGNQANA